MANRKAFKKVARNSFDIQKLLPFMTSSIRYV